MSAVLISTKGQIVLPIAIRKALGLKPGMRVEVRLEGKGARITPAPARRSAKLTDIQAILGRPPRKVSIKDMRVTQYKE